MITKHFIFLPFLSKASKTIESLDSDADEENETFECISLAMTISSLDVKRKFSVSQNVYTDKTTEKIDSLDKLLMRCASQNKQQIT